MEYLKMLKSQLEGISSNWNGDDSGVAEERSSYAEEGIFLINKLEDILKELKIN